MTDFKPKVQEVLREVVYTLARQTPGIMRQPARLDAVARTIPALREDIAVAWAGMMERLETSKNEEAASRCRQYEERLKAERHDKEYWQGRAPQAVQDMREQAALLAERAGNRDLAGRIMALRIGW